jgi:hypothetical protein
VYGKPVEVLEKVTLPEIEENKSRGKHKASLIIPPF